MIKRLKIQNFRGIKEGTLELSPITILLGPNNSGKSTILEALFLAPNPGREVPYIPLRDQNTAAGVIYFLHETLDYRGYTFLFHNYTSQLSEIECDINGDRFSLRFMNMGSLIYLTTNKEIKGAGHVSVNGVMTPYFGFLRRDSLEVMVSTPTELFMEETLLISPTLIKPAFEYLRRNWAPIINMGVCRRVAKDASTLSPESYRDLTIEPFIGGQPELYAYLEDGRRIRLGDLGEGIQNYVIARILYEVTKPKILLWDDIESHLNPRILLHMADWFSDLLKDGKQVILSTHSLEAAKVIAGVNEEETGIYLTLLDNSIFKTKKLTLSEVESFQEAGIDARTAEALLL